MHPRLRGICPPPAMRHLPFHRIHHSRTRSFRIYRSTTSDTPCSSEATAPPSPSSLPQLASAQFSPSCLLPRPHILLQKSRNLSLISTKFFIIYWQSSYHRQPYVLVQCLSSRRMRSVKTSRPRSVRGQGYKKGNVARLAF